MDLKKLVRERIDAGEHLDEVRTSLIAKGYPQDEVDKAVSFYDWREDRKRHVERRTKPRTQKTYPKHLEDKTVLHQLHNALSPTQMSRSFGDPRVAMFVGTGASMIFTVLFLILLFLMPILYAVVLVGTLYLIYMTFMLLFVGSMLKRAEIKVENFRLKALVLFGIFLASTVGWVYLTLYAIIVAIAEPGLSRSMSAPIFLFLFMSLIHSYLIKKIIVPKIPE